jgi:ABC-2 type transport system permease protein
MGGPGRYVRLLGAFGRLALATEMSFRANFLVKLVVEALWLAILVLFYELVFRNTSTVAEWTREQYLFFVGCQYALAGLIETFFLENCTHFPELVRTGDLDLYLLKPIDEQFLVSCRHVDWSTLPNVVQGAGVMAYALASMGWQFDPAQLAGFLALLGCGVAMAYSFLLMLASTSVWFVRNQSLLEMWWLFTTLMRYPRELFLGQKELWWAAPMGWFFTFVVPVLLVVNVPASTMVRALDPWFVALMVAATLALLWLSRRFFRHALRSYRSASS